MLFNSIEFLIFFLVVVSAFFLTKPKYRWALLLAASYFFYMFWKIELIVLIVFSTGIDYFCSTQMSKKQTKKARRPFLLLSILSNLGLLFTFKYLDFFTASFNAIFDIGIPYANLILPMGISFYTFQTLSYTIDVYNGKIKAEKHIGKFALYVSFFPQLVAGPIERASKLMPQFQTNENRLKFHNVVSGITQMIIGFFKKVVVADTIAIYVNSIYGYHELYTGFTLLFATYLFAIQIYCDFSGYSDIAIGAARIMGYDLMENFKQPYFSKSITEFWRRWHISLSSWLKDYLYIPLGGNKKGNLFTYKNLMITMLLGGLWHGASWNFVIWGALNGLYLAVEKKLNYHNLIIKKSRWFRYISMIGVFHLICLTWVFFRAETFANATDIISRIATPDYFFNLKIQDTGVFASIVFNLFIFILLEIFVFKKLNLRTIDTEKNKISLGLLTAVLCVLIVLFGISEGSQFIYFQF